MTLRRMNMKPHPLHIIEQSPYQFGNYGAPLAWRESTTSARQMLDLNGYAFSHLEWEAYAWPGGYEIHYITDDGGVLCHQCANKELMRTIDPDDAQFFIVESDINYEGHVQCDHCYRDIEPAYGYAEEDEACEEE
jgi:hypothetical protein